MRRSMRTFPPVPVRVEVGAPIEMTVQGRVEDTHKSIRGKVRGGGPLLRVRTGSGDIHIRVRLQSGHGFSGCNTDQEDQTSDEMLFDYTVQSA